MPIALIPATPEHATALWRIGSEDASRRFNPTSRLSFVEFRQQLAANRGDLGIRQATYRWVVMLGGSVIGHVSLKDCDWEMGHATLGYGLTETVHGRGLGTEAVRRIVAMAFRDSPLERLMALVHEANQPSRRLLEKLGFVPEGMLREHLVIHGQRTHEIIYGLLRREWQAATEETP